MNSPESSYKPEEIKTPVLTGPNVQVWQAFAHLLAIHGTPPAYKARFDGGIRDLWFAEHTPEGNHVYHLYLYSKPFTGGGTPHHLATLIRAEDGTDYSNLRYDIRATSTGGLIEKNSNGVMIPDIDDLEKTELITRLEVFQEMLKEEDPALERRAGWKKWS